MSWAGVISLVGLIASVVTGAMKLGHRDAAIDEKLDKGTYQQDQTALARELGDMHGDIRVIRAAICGRDPGACR